MAGLGVECEVLVEAAVWDVWGIVTDPEQMTLWFADRVRLVVEPGARGYMEFGDQGGPVVVEAVEAPVRFSFRWNFPEGEEPVPGNSMLVEFTLEVVSAEQTRLRVVESGHEVMAWSESEKQRYADEHREGWGEFFEKLTDSLAKR